MKVRLTHALAGFAVGLICYTVYLFCFLMFGPQNYTYRMLPIPNSYMSLEDIQTIYLADLWATHKLELVVIVAGLNFPLCFTGFAWLIMSKRPILWVSRWPAQLAFSTATTVAGYFIVKFVTFILPAGLHENLRLW